MTTNIYVNQSITKDARWVNHLTGVAYLFMTYDPISNKFKALLLLCVPCHIIIELGCCFHCDKNKRKESHLKDQNEVKF